MKLSIIPCLLFLSLSSFAGWNEVECDGHDGLQTFKLEVELPFPSGTFYRNATLTIQENGRPDIIHEQTVAPRFNTGFNKIEYWSSDLWVEVDFWPDRRPQWGRTYFGAIKSLHLGNKYIQGLNCTFPHVN
jgi:hypothetical protein